MDELSKVDGKILLVGEGGFSFSVALIQQLPSDKLGNITTSSLETEESIVKHQYARSNIEYLQQKGVTVLLSTDATKLHTNENLCQHKYSRIIFNFPHAGGKSNHKKNRKLLNDFFISASAVLECQGQILVTLCKGQGGTPSDKPMRKWHDSWQVVSMAANASLILTQVLPFVAEKYNTYTSTGFRSLDKGFHTENALTHVFERADSVDIPIDGSHVPVILNDTAYQCSRYTYFKLLQIRLICDNADHSVSQMYDTLSTKLTSCKDLQVKNHGHCFTMKCSYSPDCSSINKENSSCSLQQDHDALNTCFTIDKHHLTQFPVRTDDDICTLSQYIHIDQQLLPNVCLALKDSELSDCVTVCYGPIYSPCVISQNQSPVEYHMTICQPIKMEDSNITSEISPECLRNNETIKAATNCLKSAILQVLSDVLMPLNYTAFFCDQTSEVTSNGCGVRISTLFLKQMEYDSKIHNSYYGDKTDETHMIFGGLYCKVDNNLKSKCMLYLDIYLHKLTCLLYDITDQRLLWSGDYRITEQFSKLKKMNNVIENSAPTPLKNGSKICDSTTSKLEANNDMATNELLGLNVMATSVSSNHVRPSSMYPMTFTHDMSFWESGEATFCEIKFCETIRNVAGDVVTSVELIDMYTDTESNKTSRCYRLTFQSVDRALSYDISWKLQSLIRLEVQKGMQIILR